VIFPVDAVRRLLVAAGADPRAHVVPREHPGAIGMIVPPIAACVLGVRAWLRSDKFRFPRLDASLLVAIGLVWVVISYFPVSNIPVVLPTVRAERFWYFPVIGTCIFLGLSFDKLIGRWRALGICAFLVYLAVQGVSARRHANDYTDDLVFWDATRKAVPRSAKAHLNYSVMQGARGRLDIRLESNKTALALAPEWPMASVYLGDTLCRLGKPGEAWPYYAKGFGLAPNDINLIALGVQCLWDQGGLAENSPLRDQLKDVGEAHPGSWLEYIAHDTLDNGEEHKASTRSTARAGTTRAEAGVTVQTPYTLSVLDAFMAAQTALGTTLTAAALHRPRRPALATATMILAIWLPVLMPVLADFVKQPRRHHAAADVRNEAAFTRRAFLPRCRCSRCHAGGCFSWSASPPRRCTGSPTTSKAVPASWRRSTSSCAASSWAWSGRRGRRRSPPSATTGRRSISRVAAFSPTIWRWPPSPSAWARS